MESSDSRARSSSQQEAGLPSGSVAFLFTDVESSTAMWERHGEEMAAALEVHDRVMRETVARHGGYVFTTAGDSFAVAFQEPLEAVAAALEIQQALAEPVGSLTIRVRMGIHTGTAFARDGDYFGPVLNRAARLMAIGHGGQVLISGTMCVQVESRLGEGLSLEDLGEHQLKDLSRPEHVYQLRHPDLRMQFPPLRSLRTTLTNLPVQVTSFVGRGNELAEAGRLVREARLVTVTGTGGSGKTRLAIQLGAEVLEDFAGGVRLVELAPLTDPDLVPDEVAEALGVGLQPDRSPVDTIADKIRGRELLLILDNCEHLVATVAELVEDLLRACPDLTILATSIELLRVPGEVAYRLPPLTLPGESDDLAEVRRRDSVRLFTERALAAKPDFAVTADNVRAVVAITRSLDGMALGLELAAARLRTLSAQQIADRLDQRFRLLAGGRRTRVARHQTLQAAIDWSHDLLTEPEQVLFRRLSVFAGNFTIAAVEAVCCADPLDPFEAFDLLAELVDKSMVATEEGPGGDNRFRMLQTLRRYADLRLEEAGEQAPTKAAHVDYYVELAAELDERYMADVSGPAVEQLGADQDNFRAALGFALDGGAVEAAALIFGRLWFLWYRTGRSREAVDWGRDLFALDPQLSDEVLAEALHGHGTLLGIWEEAEAGIVILEREVELRRTMEDPRALASALNNLGSLLRDTDRTEDAERAIEEAIIAKRSVGLSTWIEQVNLAEVYLNRDEHDEARDHFAAALTEATDAVDSYGVALATFNLGQCAVRRGEPGAARPLLETARRSFGAQGIRPGVAETDFFLALVDRADTRPVEAARQLLGSLDAADAHWTRSLAVWIFQAAAAIVGDAEAGAEILGAASAQEARISEPQPPYFQRDRAAAHERLAGALGEERFAARFAAGERLSMDEAVARTRRALMEVI